MQATSVQGVSDSDQAAALQHQPLIGIVTMPKQAAGPMGDLGREQYILDINRGFMEQGGSRVVAISYDISHEELIKILDSINGVLLTGGNVVLIDPETKEFHQYYKTVSAIIHYAMRAKDTRQDSFPILGICQGFQILSMVIAGDINTLEDIKVIGQNRKKVWKVADPRSNSKLFSRFEEDLIKAFEEQELCVHFHNYAFSVEKFNSLPNLADQLLLLQTDILDDGTEFVSGFEAKNYPFYAVLYHPEYQQYKPNSMFKFNKCDETLRIVKHLTALMFEQSSLNKNRPPAGYTHEHYPLLTEVNREIVDQYSKMMTEDSDPFVALTMDSGASYKLYPHLFENQTQ
eukprot:403363421